MNTRPVTKPKIKALAIHGRIVLKPDWLDILMFAKEPVAQNALEHLKGATK